MREVVRGLLDIIQLEQLEQNLFRGQTVATGQRSIFGGLVAGQALMAASRTVPDARPVHSLHAYFLRPGDFSVPIIYDVDRIRDGKSFTTRRVNAIQHGKAIFSLAASYQEPEEGVEHQTDMPDVPAPETLESDDAIRRQFAERIPDKFRAAFLQERPVEFRPIKPANSFEAEPQDPTRLAWFRISDRIDVDEATNRALLTFCSDFGLMGTAMLPHGMNFFQPHVQAASLDHAMWFHRPFRVDEWLLYATDAPTATGARGINRGLIYRQDGTLVASVVQEGLMRLHEQEPRV
ncbi:MAG: acyl-CoA thioesterase II [Alcanivoracaceae bacterium]|nr:acyl-CoA thioesterase II [Alcanivoracaceae bacterium]